jgi:diguanylate cyclase (GGDEF)-like protein
MIAERLRQNVETLVLPGIRPITISLGVSYWNHLQGEPETSLKRADEALYKAKQEGRNRVVVGPE